MISRFRSRKQPVLIIYASVTGNAAKYASDLGAILRSGCNVSFVDACGVNSSVDQETLCLIESSTLTIFVSSTQGNGELPSLSQKFFSTLFDHSGHILKGRNCAVLGFGSTAYPVFCGAAAHLSSKLAEQGAQEVVVRGQCDAVEGESPAFYQWTSNLVTTLAHVDNASPFMLKLANSMAESTASSLVQQRNLMRSIKIEFFTHEEVESAAAKSYMRRCGTMGSLRGSFTGGVVEKHETPRRERIMKIIATSSQQETLAKNMLAGRVISREDLVGSGLGNEVGRKTSVLKIDLKSCGDPPYQPGDHVRVFPRNVVSEHHLREFIGHLSGDISLLDHMYVTFEDSNMPKSELAVALPLVHDNLEQLVPMGYFFEKVVALLAPIPMQALGEMAELATSKKEKVMLKTLGQNKTEYERMNSFNSLKWLGLFGWFPSLSKRISIPFLLCNMKRNHPRSYSISSCKAIVGSELHLCVGRYLYSGGGSRKEAGICSSFLTSVEPGDEILFKLESAPSFHHPLDPSCPVIFICAGTGFAPIRGLLMQRSYFQSRGEKLGAAYMFFGCRCSREGLFHDDLRELVNKRVLTKCYMCYSREPGQQRQHTTDKLQSAKMKAIIAPILKRGDSHVFICGSANLAEQSKSALAEMTSETYMDDFIARGRLHCDVFGAVTPTSSSRPRFVDEIMNTERSGIGMPMD
jgi:sulfite reductase alpha subunit-like flavoprotein